MARRRTSRKKAASRKRPPRRKKRKAAPAKKRSLRAAFQTARRGKAPALVAYVTAGDPHLKFSLSLVLALAEAGADVIELGVPFSDPIADGPVIQRASVRALAGGTTLSKVLALAKTIRRKSEVPLVLFSYINPVLQMGVERFAERAAAAGVSGVLITDLTPEEAGGFVKRMRRVKLDTVFLVAPTSTPARLRAIVGLSRGFVYVISRRGTTGQREDVPSEVRSVVKRVRRLTRLPVAVGFGISRPDHVASLTGVADGVVVGSAIVECCERAGHAAAAVEAAAQFVRELKEGSGSIRGG